MPNGRHIKLIYLRHLQEVLLFFIPFQIAVLIHAIVSSPARQFHFCSMQYGQCYSSVAAFELSILTLPAAVDQNLQAPTQSFDLFRILLICLLLSCISGGGYTERQRLESFYSAIHMICARGWGDCTHGATQPMRVGVTRVLSAMAMAINSKPNNEAFPLTFLYTVRAKFKRKSSTIGAW